MEIHLIRHTPVCVESGICYGQSDVPLRDNYLHDFEELLLDRDYDIVISSPLKRCTLMAEYFSLAYTTDKRIMELNFGDWELKYWEQIPSPEIQPWYDNYIHVAPPNGESMVEMQHRVYDFFDHLKKKYSDNKILIITHAGVIRLMIQKISEIPIEEIFSIEVIHGRKTIIIQEQNHLKISQTNI